MGVKSGLASGVDEASPDFAFSRLLVKASTQGVLTRMGIHVGRNAALGGLEWNSFDAIKDGDAPAVFRTVALRAAAARYLAGVTTERRVVGPSMMIHVVLFVVDLRRGVCKMQEVDEK